MDASDFQGRVQSIRRGGDRISRGFSRLADDEDLRHKWGYRFAQGIAGARSHGQHDGVVPAKGEDGAVRSLALDAVLVKPGNPAACVLDLFLYRFVVFGQCRVKFGG